jgi:ribose/xylose/arabinose/galactoside ABC-type transport system permease subunit
MSLVALGRLLVTLGVLVALAGFFLLLLGRIGVGHLPGDFFFRRGRVSFFFPIATCLLISLFLSLLLTLLARWRR